MRKAAQPSKAWTEKSSVDGRLKSARLALKRIGPRDPQHARLVVSRFVMGNHDIQLAPPALLMVFQTMETQKSINR